MFFAFFDEFFDELSDFLFFFDEGEAINFFFCELLEELPFDNCFARSTCLLRIASNLLDKGDGRPFWFDLSASLLRLHRLPSDFGDLSFKLLLLSAETFSSFFSRSVGTCPCFRLLLDDFAEGDLAAGDLAAGDLAAGDFAAGDFAAGDFAAGDFPDDPREGDLKRLASKLAMLARKSLSLDKLRLFLLDDVCER
ncbi:hypothetical protein TTRE_0000017201 [Trichuris trichiura]|uniref:Uncharacterized protein n=1 Tax=Trichuris trichiura TaxID=36087 RepID=A0A077YWR6_TRITR|nr:hypothetical protein TTRE_0000017201 [Trichuris trichiura]